MKGFCSSISSLVAIRSQYASVWTVVTGDVLANHPLGHYNCGWSIWGLIEQLGTILERFHWTQSVKSGKRLNTQLIIFVGNFRLILVHLRVSLK